MSIESDHINILIYRYLLESGKLSPCEIVVLFRNIFNLGFQHSGFTFAQEAGITKSSVYNQKIPPGSLIAHLQRGLNYVQAEINLTEVGLFWLMFFSLIHGQDGRPADLEDLEAVEALTLLESVQVLALPQHMLGLCVYSLRFVNNGVNNCWNA